MTRTRRGVARTLAGCTALVTVAGVGLPLLTATPALAATTAVDASPETANNGPGDNAHTITYTNTNDANGASPIRFVIVSGPNADLANNGVNATDESAGTSPAAGQPANTATAGSFSYTNGTTNGQRRTGTDTIRVFADVNNNSLYDSGEPFDDVAKTWSGDAFSVTMTPDADSAAVNTCNPFTVVVRDAAGNPAAAGTVVDIAVTQTSTPVATGASNVQFCDPTADGGPGGTNVQAVGDQDPTAATATGASGRREGEVTTNENGTVTFGVVSNEAGTFRVQSWVETDNDDVLEANEPSDTSTKTFTAGGAEGVNTLTVTPKTDTNPIGTAHVVTATLRNAQGDPVSGVTPLFDVTAGPNAATVNQQACTTSNQAGQSTCTYTGGTTTGTDTILVFVNQQATTGGAPRTAGPDAGEPQDTAQKTWVAGVASTQIDLVCTGTRAGGTAAPAPNGETAAQRTAREETCVNPTSSPTETFTARVTTDTNGDNVREPANGALVTFAIDNRAGTTQDATLSSQSCTTGTDGTCSVTVTNPDPSTATPDSYRVTATTATNNATVSDDATKTYAARVPTTVDVTPEVATNQVNTAHSVTAVVTDQFGDAVQNANVDFRITGRNTAERLNVNTDAQGRATTSYTDIGAANAGGTDTITAIVDRDTDNATPAEAGEPTDTATKVWITEATTAGLVDLDMDDTVATGGLCETGAAAESTRNVALPSTNWICATVRTASGSNTLAGQTVTFTIAGVGTFDNGTKTITRVTGSTGQAAVSVTSSQSGTSTVTATAGSASDTGTLVFAQPAPNTARNVVLQPSADQRLGAGEALEFTARVTDRHGNPIEGVAVNFTETTPGRFATGTSSAQAVTGPTGTATVTLVSDANASGSGTVTASITNSTTPNQCADAANTVGGVALPAGQTAPAGNCTDSTNVTIAQASAFARTVTLTPETATATSGAGATLTATVRDASGAPVQGVAVRFTESGPGGLATTTATTNASGTATVTTTSAATDEGAQTVTAEIAAADTECDVAAGTPTGAPAGVCSDSSTVTYSRGSGPGNIARPTITVNPAVITARQGSTVTVVGTPGARVELWAYTRPSTTYFRAREAIIPATGSISWVVTPPGNTRLFARSCAAPLPTGQTNCAATANTDSASVVISVRSAVSLTATRGHNCTATFTGRVIPARTGQLVNLYSVGSAGSLTLVGQTRVGSDGTYTYTRAFQACGQTVTFLTRTGSDINNLGGQSNTRTFTFIR